MTWVPANFFACARRLGWSIKVVNIAEVSLLDTAIYALPAKEWHEQPG